jgi:hypothetical protein
VGDSQPASMKAANTIPAHRISQSSSLPSTVR